MEDKEGPKNREDHSRLVGGKFNKQRSLHTRLLLGGHKISGSPRPPEVCVENLTGFSHIYSPDGLNSTLLSQSCILELAPSEWSIHSEDREGGEEPPIAQVQLKSQLPITSSWWPPPKSYIRNGWRLKRSLCFWTGIGRNNMELWICFNSLDLIIIIMILTLLTERD